jgi:hypothetical protein
MPHHRRREEQPLVGMTERTAADEDVVSEDVVMPDDYEAQASALAASIRLGYEAEADDPNIAFEQPPDDEVQWLAGWLVSEGWSRAPNVPRQTP